LPAGQDSSPTKLTLPPPKDRDRCRRSISRRLLPSQRPRKPRPNPLPHTSVEADFAVELGVDDETLELPWAAADGGPRYYDLKRQPELLLNVEEASRVPELAEFLVAMNSPAGILETAKCDSWPSTEINPEEEIFGATDKFCCYVDLLFSQEAQRYSFAEHEQFAKRITQLLKRVPEIPAAVELLIRRAFYHVADEIIREGFYITLYLFGYGDDEAQARQRWAIALKLVENAIRQGSM